MANKYIENYVPVVKLQRGLLTKYGINTHLKGVLPGTTNANVGGQGVEISGNDNTNAGINLILSNNNPGANSFSDLFMQNDLANASGTHFAIVGLNSSGYSNTGFGAIVAVPNQLALYGTDGPTTIGTAANQYVNFFVGGTANANEVGRFNANGLSLSSSFTRNYVAASATYPILATDGIINCTSGTFTATLPTAVGVTGKEYTVKNSGSGAITVATTSSQTIDGATTYALSAQYKYVHVVSNGANWIIVANN